jgi:hypothetical protein
MYSIVNIFYLKLNVSEYNIAYLYANILPPFWINLFAEQRGGDLYPAKDTRNFSYAYQLLLVYVCIARRGKRLCAYQFQ